MHKVHNELFEPAADHPEGGVSEVMGGCGDIECVIKHAGEFPATIFIPEAQWSSHGGGAPIPKSVADHLTSEGTRRSRDVSSGLCSSLFFLQTQPIKMADKNALFNTFGHDVRWILGACNLSQGEILASDTFLYP